MPSLSTTPSTVQLLPSGMSWGTVSEMSTCSSVGAPAENVGFDPVNTVTAPQPLVQLALTVPLAKPDKSSVTCSATPIAPAPPVTSTLAGSVANDVKTGGVVSTTALAEMAAKLPPTLAAVAVAAMKASARRTRRFDNEFMARLPLGLAGESATLAGSSWENLGPA